MGKNQRMLLRSLQDLSAGRVTHDITYYGGCLAHGRRSISIGRECTLYYDVPWWIIDVRHAGAIFRQEHGSRLKCNTLRTFNRALHALIYKGMVIPLSADIITQGLCNAPQSVIQDAMAQRARTGNIRFVVMNVPNAL